MRSIFFFLWLICSFHILYSWVKSYILGSRSRHAKPVIKNENQGRFISVLVPAWNEAGVIKTTLASLHDSKYPSWEALVIAGGDDGTEACVRSLCADWSNFNILHQEPRGKNAALNLGLAQAKGEIIVVLDADTQVDSDWLSCLISSLTEDQAASSSNYFPVIRTWVSTYFEMEKISVYSIHHVSVLRGCGFAIKRKVLEQLGGFPENITVGVDWDLDLRLQRVGCKRAYSEDARLKTMLPYTLKQFWQNQVRWRKAHFKSAITFRKPSFIYFYLVGLAFFLCPLAAVCFGRINGGWQIWPLFWVWVLLRRLSLSLEVAAYCNDKWLKWAWVPVALLPIDFMAGLVAMASAYRKIIFFKGPRPGLSS
jgi:cellulose synthase/poly-beta-1,6-N-acetylglucosamine synthase-like glycosyltransferase